MDNDELVRLPLLPWMPSRIPKRNAIVAFVKDGEACPLAVEAAMKGTQSRWYPENGGHRVLILHDAGAYDENSFHLEHGIWDHEHCDVCGEIIKSMILCYVTEQGPYIALCAGCYRRHVLSKFAYWFRKIFGSNRRSEIRRS